jgi:hypothetical protein
MTSEVERDGQRRRPVELELKKQAGCGTCDELRDLVSAELSLELPERIVMAFPDS